MDPLTIISLVSVPIFLACSAFGYAFFILMKRIRAMEQKIRDANEIMKNIGEVLESSLVVLQGANQLLLIISNKSENKATASAKDGAAESGVTIH